jgi:predicted transcriptional regulator
MAAVKQQVMQIIQSLPEEVTVDDIMAELYFKLQVDTGLQELDEGKGIPHEEIEKRMSNTTSLSQRRHCEVKPKQSRL